MPGPDMVVDGWSKEWRVSLVHLEPDTSYTVQISLTDPDGVFSDDHIREFNHTI